MPLGDPWLTAGLLKVGDPIYLVKWETDAPVPTLLHIQSIADVEMFGISGANYGAMIFESPAWEAQFGLPVATLSKAELAAAASADDGYTADWSCGLNGWSGTADWQVSGGMLVNDGTNGKSL